MSSSIRSLSLLSLLAVAASGHADLVVNSDLGLRGLSLTSLQGTTFGRANNADGYSNSSDRFAEEFVYSFTLNAPARIGTREFTSGSNHSIFLLSSRTTETNELGERIGRDAIDEPSSSSPDFPTTNTFKIVGPGTYFLSVDTLIGENPPTEASQYTFDFDLFVQPARPAPAATAASLGGSISRPLGIGETQFYRFDYTGGALAFDTEGSSFFDGEGNIDDDTELGLYDALGNLVDDDDDGGPVGNTSRLSFDDGELLPGTYYLAASAYETEHEDFFIAASSSDRQGTIVVNGLSPVPEPASMAALGMGALALLRRRRR